MTSPDGVAVNPEGGNDRVELTTEEQQRLNAVGSTNDLSNPEKGTSDQVPLTGLMNKDSGSQNKSPGDGQVQETQSATDQHNVQPQSGVPNESRDPTAKWVEQRDEDLSIILIVAGLFSAVTSAFIIYIHPQLQPDPEEESAALLRVILYKIDNTTFGGDIPELPTWTGPPSVVVAALVLLYLSLAATTGSALIAILVKQLLNLYTGALESNNYDQTRQRRAKRFTRFLREIILFLSFLLQFALLFSSCALTVYIWKINLLIALFILALTICSIPFYIYLVVAAASDIIISHLRYIRQTPNTGIANIADRFYGRL